MASYQAPCCVKPPVSLSCMVFSASQLSVAVSRDSSQRGPSQRHRAAMQRLPRWSWCASCRSRRLPPAPTVIGCRTLPLCPATRCVRLACSLRAITVAPWCDHIRRRPRPSTGSAVRVVLWLTDRFMLRRGKLDRFFRLGADYWYCILRNLDTRCCQTVGSLCFSGRAGLPHPPRIVTVAVCEHQV